MILSGYLGSPDIAAVVADFVARAKAKNPALLYCCDPVLGDRDRGLFVHADIPPLVRDRLSRSPTSSRPIISSSNGCAGPRPRRSIRRSRQRARSWRAA